MSNRDNGQNLTTTNFYYGTTTPGYPSSTRDY